MNKYIISIIVPCYNQAEYLPEALDSVLAQSSSNWECIIVDDGSPDNTAMVAAEYVKKDSRFKYLHKENSGLPGARNAGIKISAGEFILPLDADDVIAPQYIELGLKAFEENNQLKLVYCKAMKFGTENAPFNLPQFSYVNLLSENCIFCSAMFRKQSWSELNGYDESLIKGLEDWEFWIRMLDPDSQVRELPQTLFYYRIKSTSMLSTISDTQHELIKWSIFEKNISKYRPHFISPISAYAENGRIGALNDKLMRSNSYRTGNWLLKPMSFFKRALRAFSQ